MLECCGVRCDGMARVKTSRQLERHFKGVANHWRIDVLRIVSKDPEITLDQITERLEANSKTISEHTRKLTNAGLIAKSYRGRSVMHVLSPCGEAFLNFMAEL